MRPALALLLALASLAGATSPVANKTAAVLGAVSAKQKELLALLKAGPSAGMQPFKKNLPDPLATLKTDLNATTIALKTEAALKLNVGLVANSSRPRFVGDVTCYVDTTTGDVVSLHMGSREPLCSPNVDAPFTRRSFTVPADGYIGSVYVVVDKATGLVGQMQFVIKSNATLLSTDIVTCGSHGGIGVDIMPKLAKDGSSLLPRAAALSRMTAGCKPMRSGRRLHQARDAVLDPATLKVEATTVTPSTCSSGRRLLQSGGCGNPWMGRMSSVLGPKTLSEVVIPGTHDSGTSGLVPTFWSPWVSNTAQTQTRTIGQQLSDGIRFFDLRVREAHHYDCADPTVFWLYHSWDSYPLITALEDIQRFCQNPTNAKEIIILDLQDINVIYEDNRAAGVLLRTIQDYLEPYLLPFDDDDYKMLGPGAKNLSSIWQANSDKKANRQVLVLAPNSTLSRGDLLGCGQPFDTKWFGNRKIELKSFYEERAFSSEIKNDIDAQLSYESALLQNRTSLYSSYADMEQQSRLRVHQVVARPSNAWYAAAFAGFDCLLNYASFINHSFNDCPNGTSGWFGQRLWAGLTIPYNWTRPNIILVDNYLAVIRPPKDPAIPSPPPSPVNWRTMAWNSSDGQWVQQSVTGSYVDFVTSLNYVERGNLTSLNVYPSFGNFSSNNNCYQW